MKKITFLAVAALAISFASCKKERVCECTVTSTNGSVTTTSTETITYTKIAKSDAKFACQKRSNTSTPSSGAVNTSTWDCKLK